MNYKLVAFAQEFTAFLIHHLDKESDKIANIILFGSVSRGEAEENSDIDIFIDVTDEKMEKKIAKIKDLFYKSYLWTSYWKLLDIQNELHCIVGKLKEWDSLQRSIIANGITLFGKYHAEVKTEHWYMFTITQGKSRNVNLSLWRSLYGYTQKIGKKVYVKKGLISEYGGKKLARGVMSVPARYAATLAKFLASHKVSYKLMPFWKEKD